MPVIDIIRQKIAESMQSAADTTAAWREQQQAIVFTNGCFDLLHYGHVHLLAAAKAFGDRLIVGVNSDASVRALKGPGRPIKSELHRTSLLAAMEIVDLVVVFSDPTPLALIHAVVPDVLVKGGDWSVDQIVGASFVLERGGRVERIPYLQGYSTTNFEEQIKRDSQSNVP